MPLLNVCKILTLVVQTEQNVGDISANMCLFTGGAVLVIMVKIIEVVLSHLAPTCSCLLNSVDPVSLKEHETFGTANTSIVEIWVKNVGMHFCLVNQNFNRLMSTS